MTAASLVGVPVVAPGEWIPNQVDKRLQEIDQLQAACDHQLVWTGQFVTTRYFNGQPLECTTEEREVLIRLLVVPGLISAQHKIMLYRCTLCSLTQKIDRTRRCPVCLNHLIKISDQPECPACGSKA